MKTGCNTTQFPLHTKQQVKTERGRERREKYERENERGRGRERREEYERERESERGRERMKERWREERGE
jgi:hypothetical protein